MTSNSENAFLPKRGENSLIRKNSDLLFNNFANKSDGSASAPNFSFPFANLNNNASNHPIQASFFNKIVNSQFSQNNNFENNCSNYINNVNNNYNKIIDLLIRSSNCSNFCQPSQELNQSSFMNMSNSYTRPFNNPLANANLMDLSQISNFASNTTFNLLESMNLDDLNKNPEMLNKHPSLNNLGGNFNNLLMNNAELVNYLSTYNIYFSEKFANSNINQNPNSLQGKMNQLDQMNMMALNSTCGTSVNNSFLNINELNRLSHSTPFNNKGLFQGMETAQEEGAANIGLNMARNTPTIQPIQSLQGIPVDLQAKMQGGISGGMPLMPTLNLQQNQLKSGDNLNNLYNCDDEHMTQNKSIRDLTIINSKNNNLNSNFPSSPFNFQNSGLNPNCQINNLVHDDPPMNSTCSFNNVPNFNNSFPNIFNSNLGTMGMNNNFNPNLLNNAPINIEQNLFNSNLSNISTFSNLSTLNNNLRHITNLNSKVFEQSFSNQDKKAEEGDI